MRRRLADLLHGPHARLPRPLDVFSERWARLPPRMRAMAVVVLVIAAALTLDAHRRALESRWGGPARPVLVATRHLDVGEHPGGAVERARVPPVLAPAGAVDDVRDDTVLSLALPRGAVLTQAHLDARGPAAGLAGAMRVVPIPVEAGWGVDDAEWVDVWTLGAGDLPARNVARQRPVVAVHQDASATTALVGMDTDEVEDVTTGLALGTVLLTHAPPPER